MRDFSCFSDATVTLAAGAAGGGRGGGGAGGALNRWLQAATASDYRVALSSRKELWIKVTWTRGVAAGASGGGRGWGADRDRAGHRRRVVPGASSSGGGGADRHAAPDGPGARARARAALPAEEARDAVLRHRRRHGGLHLLGHGRGQVLPRGAAEPSRDYHLAVVADGELALLLGGGGEAACDVRRCSAAESRSAGPSPPALLLLLLVAAQAQLVHTTRCRFRDDGAEHEVTVTCRGHEWGSRDGEVAVSVDGKKVVEARRVKWNFRGNRTAVLGNGAVVEVMWDVHDWWFTGVSGGGSGDA